MKENYLWTKLGARLKWIKAQKGKPYHWLFLPGGPGLGAESLANLTQCLTLPGTLWHLDLPGDGSNTTENNSASFSRWSEALVEAVSVFSHVILVAHSTGGMYVLATPALEKKLSGLVLLDSAPNASWQKTFMAYVNRHPIAKAKTRQEIYTKSPNNETLKKVIIASASYVFTSQGLKAGIQLFKKLPINFETCEWSAQYFDADYKAKWIPKNIPTLILGGEHDHITPLILFTQIKRFHRKNIVIKKISDAGHYPWIENPREVKKAFLEYTRKFL
jgi:pimeloyl-ACP methyl ester carboxylesterase